MWNHDTQAATQRSEVTVHYGLQNEDLCVICPTMPDDLNSKHASTKTTQSGWMSGPVDPGDWRPTLIRSLIRSTLIRLRGRDGIPGLRHVQNSWHILGHVQPLLVPVCNPHMSRADHHHSCSQEL